MKEPIRLLTLLLLGLALAVNAHSQSFLTNGLVAYYPFDGNANDASGNGNNGTVLGTDWNFLPDRFGNPERSLFLNMHSPPSWTLNGAYVSAPRSASLDFGGDFTLSVWVNISSLSMTNINEYLISNGNDGATYRRVGLAVSCTSPVYGGNDDLSCAWGAGFGPGYVVVPVRDSWWQFVAVRSATNLTLFKNGFPLTNYVATTAPQNSPLIWLGRFQPVPTAGNDNTWPLVGGIDDVRMYNRALSSNEVAQLYAIESVPPPCPPHKATATATLYNWFLVDATITDGGCGYTTPPAVLVQGGGGSGGAATAVVSNGMVVKINITDAGAGYTSAPKIVIGSPPFVPTLSIAVSKVKVTQNVVLGRSYVLEASHDLVTWTATGPHFTAQEETLVNEFDVDLTGRYFRIRQVAP